MAPPRRKRTERAKPHARKKTAAADRADAPIDLDALWAAQLRERVLDSCHPFQRDAVTDPSKYISLLVGRGGGKTTVKRARALLLITSERHITVAYVATSKPEARRLNWEPTQELIRQLGAWDEFDFHETRLEIRCKRTGSVYAFFGAEDRAEVNKLRGQPFRELQIDEAASHRLDLLEYLIEEAVGPRLGEHDAAIVLGGTPGHILRGLFYDVTRPGSDDDVKHRPFKFRDDPVFAGWIGWSSHHWTAPDVLAIPGAREMWPAIVKNWERALVDKAKNKWSDSHPKWLREYLAIWAADSTTMMYQYRARIHGDEALAAGVPDGALWNRWEPYGDLKLEGLAMLDAAIAALPKDLGELVFGYGADLGSKDPFALNVAALAPSDPLRRIWHVFSFERRRMYAKTIAELLIGPEAVAHMLRGEPYVLGGLFGRTGWPIAFVADLAALGQAVIDELGNVYGIKVEAAEKKDKPGAIEVVNGDLTDARMLILADTPLEAQLGSLQWKPDEWGNPKEDKAAANHSADSWTYIRTRIGTMWTGPSAPPPTASSSSAAARPNERPGRAPRQPAMPARPAEPTPQDRGEFGSLLLNDNFPQIDPWGNG